MGKPSVVYGKRLGYMILLGYLIRVTQALISIYLGFVNHKISWNVWYFLMQICSRTMGSFLHVSCFFFMKHVEVHGRRKITKLSLRIFYASCCKNPVYTYTYTYTYTHTRWQDQVCIWSTVVISYDHGDPRAFHEYSDCLSLEVRSAVVERLRWLNVDLMLTEQLVTEVSQRFPQNCPAYFLQPFKSTCQRSRLEFWNLELKVWTDIFCPPCTVFFWFLHF